MNNFEQFVREMFRGGIGNPDVDNPDFEEVLKSILAIQEANSGQKSAFLARNERYDIWVSGSRHSAIVWNKRGLVRGWSVAFDRESSLDLSEHADYVISVSTDNAGYHLMQTIINMCS